MRQFTILMIFLLTLGCGNSETKNELPLIKNNSVDSVNSELVDSVVKAELEYLAKELNPIRKRFQELKFYDEKGWSAIDKRKAGDDLNEGHIIYHYLHGELRKLTLVQFDSLKATRYRTTIYMEDTIPFFAYKREFDSLQFREDEKWYEPFEDSIFFDKGEIIRIKSSGDCGSPFSREYILEEELDIKSKINLSLDKKTLPNNS